MCSSDLDNSYESTLNLVKIFVESNQRKRIKLLGDIESEVDNLSALGDKLFVSFDKDGDDWAVGWLLQVIKKHNPEYFEDDKYNKWFNTYSDANIN